MISFNVSLYSHSIIKIILTHDHLGMNFTFVLVFSVENWSINFQPFQSYFPKILKRIKFFGVLFFLIFEFLSAHPKQGATLTNDQKWIITFTHDQKWIITFLYSYQNYRWKSFRSANPGTPKVRLFISNCFDVPSYWLPQ